MVRLEDQMECSRLNPSLEAYKATTDYLISSASQFAFLCKGQLSPFFQFLQCWRLNPGYIPAEATALWLRYILILIK